MLDWLIVAAIAVLLVPAIFWARRHAKGKVGGAMMMLGVIFSGMFDPASRSATEQLDRRKNSGNPDKNQSGAPPSG